MHNNSQGPPHLLFNQQQWPIFYQNQGYNNNNNNNNPANFNNFPQPLMFQQTPQQLQQIQQQSLMSTNFTFTSSRGHAPHFNQKQHHQQQQQQLQQQQQIHPQSLLDPSITPPNDNNHGNNFNPNAPIMPLLAKPIQPPKTTPLMMFQPNQTPQPLFPPHQNIPPTAQKSVVNVDETPSESAAIKEEKYKYKTNRYDNSKSVEQFVEEYFSDSIKNLRKKPNTVDNDINNLNIEIQTIDYKHGMSSISTRTTMLSEVTKQEESIKSGRQEQSSLNSTSYMASSHNPQQPPSLLSLKIPPLPEINPNMMALMGPKKPKPQSLFPILNDSSQETANDSALSNENSNKPISIEEILHKPGRDRRPKKMVMILRGPPGSGKSFLANLIKQEEEKFVSASEKPKILSIDNYFISEQETAGSSNKKLPDHQILMKYEYDQDMDESYQRSLIKSFKKTIDDDLFNLIIVDMINESISKIDEMSFYAKIKGFHTFIIELNQNDADTCYSRNVHNRKLEDINKIIENWEILPSSYTRLDVSFFLQNQNKEIEYVEMDENGSTNEETSASNLPEANKTENEQSLESQNVSSSDLESTNKQPQKSKWETSNEAATNNKRAKPS